MLCDLHSISFLNYIFKDKNMSIYNMREILILFEAIFLMYRKYNYLNCVNFPTGY